jgi:hypothetical protein
MQLQPFFPEPMSVPGNITLERHRTIVDFARRVIGIGAAAVVVIAVLAWVMPPLMTLERAGLLFLGILLVLTLVRRLIDGGLADNLLSGLLLAALLPVSAQLTQRLLEHNIPIWVLGVCALQAALYSAACGRDFSFFGLFAIPWLVQVAMFPSLAAAGAIAWSSVLPALGIGALGLFFITYDLAMILRRRRRGEEIAAGADLFRDQLNFITYTFRILAHWRRFRGL